MDPEINTWEWWRDNNDVFQACGFIRAGWQMSVGDGNLRFYRDECVKYLRWKLKNWQSFGWAGDSPEAINYDNAVKNLIMATLNMYEVNPEGMLCEIREFEFESVCSEMGTGNLPK